MKNEAPIQVKVTPEIKEKFKNAAAHNAHNPSALIRKWIENYIEENSKEGN